MPLPAGVVSVAQQRARRMQADAPKKPLSVAAKLAKDALMMEGRIEESVPCHAPTIVTSGYDAS